MRTTKPITVAEAVRRVEHQQFVLPGIQRHFVWDHEQIADLFDSLMRGYPIGSLIVWRTRPIDHKGLPFRRLVRDYDGRGILPLKASPPQDQAIDAVLDGQQRLTALTIGVRGTYRKKANGPEHALFIDVDGTDTDAGPDERAFRFAFRSTEPQDHEGTSWLRVSATFGRRRDSASAVLRGAGISPTPARLRLVKRLIAVVNTTETISMSVERSTDLDRVLNIFARINKGGTPLTYVDLLVGTATARWQNLDAAEKFTELQRELGATGRDHNGEGFAIPMDRIVKAGLVLLDVRAPKFHVDSFQMGNKGLELEEKWPQFTRALKGATLTLAEFGLSKRTLRGQNVLIPVAYYFWHRNLAPSYAYAAAHARDRRLVRAFVARTLLQRAYWTGGIDSVLIASRSAIREHGAEGFPLDEIAREMPKAKRIDVTDALVHELATLPYQDQRTLTLLRMLFPDHAVKSRLEKDHIVPTEKFNAHQQRIGGVSDADYDSMFLQRHRLPNLQLLEKADNISKHAKMPADWLRSLPAGSRALYSQQGVKRAPSDLGQVQEFWNKRSAFLEARIRNLLDGPRQL